MKTEIVQPSSQSVIDTHDILLQQLQLQQLIILGLVLLIILLVPVTIYVIKKQKQTSTHWRGLLRELEQSNQDVTFRNEAQKAIITSLHERLNVLETQKPAEPSFDEYTEILSFYRKINLPLISFMESIQLSAYEMFICILIIEKVPLKNIAVLLDKNYDTIKKRKQRIQNKMRLSNICMKGTHCTNCPLHEVIQICPL